MELTTRFTPGDQVWSITNEATTVRESCGFCDGGHITGANGKKRACPECQGRGGFFVPGPSEWVVVGSLTIGRVGVRYTAPYRSPDGDMSSNYGDQRELREEEYMAYETWIGSGRLYAVDRLFATEVEAQSACDALNALNAALAPAGR